VSPKGPKSVILNLIQNPFLAKFRINWSYFLKECPEMTTKWGAYRKNPRS